MIQEIYIEFVRMMQIVYGCDVTNNFELQIGESNLQIECRLNFQNSELFAEFIQFFHSYNEEQRLIENTPSVKRAYEEFRVLYKLANGEN